jgi:TolB-like protein/DNA-binding SARP family transcriptional activator/Flp pilus assembly protein TadD
MWELRILGATDLKQPQGYGGSALHLQPKRFALLAYLALASARGSRQRDTVLLLFWPELNEGRGRNALNQALHNLRQALGPGTLLSRGADQLTVSRGRLWCDATAFEQARLAGEHADALDLYAGDLLQGLHVPESPEFEFWLHDERQRLRSLASASALRLADEAEAGDNLPGATRWLGRLIELEPDNEEALRRLMHLLERAGDRAGALRAFKRFEHRFRRELDLELSDQTTGAMTRIRGQASVSTGRPPEVPGTSIAVLPFANLSGDPDQAYFCDGMTEALTHTLSQMPGFQVAARSSAMAFRDRAGDMGEIGRKLQVSHVLEGSVQKWAGRLRVTAQLIRVPGGFHVASLEYDREVGDVFAVQTDIARNVAIRLHGALAEAQPIEAAGTADLQAYDGYLRGRFLLRKRNPRDLERAVGILGEVVGRDPGFARAHAALGEARALQGVVYQDVLPSRACIPGATAALEEALRLDPRQAEALALLGVLKAVHQWDWYGAEEAIREALAMAPGSGAVHLCRANVLIYGGRPEQAVEAMETALRLEPFVLSFRETYCVACYLSRRYEAALERVWATLEMDPGLHVASVLLGDTLTALGRTDEALAAYDRAIRGGGRRPYVLSALGVLYASLGREREAVGTLEEMAALSGDCYVRPTYVASVYAALGDHGRALDQLELAYAERDLHLASINVEPRFDPLRAEPRYAALLETVGSLETDSRFARC